MSKGNDAVFTGSNWKRQTEERLALLQEGRTAYLVVFDVDDFKQINDTNGHFYGDAVICSFAEALEREFPKAVTGRIGEDEFLAYIEDMGRDELEMRLNILNHFMSDRFNDNKSGQTITCSAGVAITHGVCNDYNVLYQWADCALYKVKSGNKGSFELLEVPADMSLPDRGYIHDSEDGGNFVEKRTLIGNDEELLLFVTELLENVPDINTALRMISERTCRFYDLDDIVCVEHSGDSNKILCQWSSSQTEQFEKIISDKGVYEWSHLSHLSDPEGCIRYNARRMKDIDMGAAKSVLVVLSVSVRGYSGSMIFADRRRDRDWTIIKNTIVRISNQIFYKLRVLKNEEKRLRAMDLKLNYDGLTGLPVYNRFISSAKEYIKHYGNQGLCCIYSDFSGFQYFNETYGYETGDKILKKFADALTVRYGGCGIFSRVSSDHFVGIVLGMSLDEAMEDYREFTSEFASGCNSEYPLTNIALMSGIYEVQGNDHSIGAMIDNANEARKKCKEQKVNTMVKAYTENLRKELEQIKNINSNILKGLNNGEFYAYLQPKISLKTGKITGAEALVRWLRPDGSRIMPDEFIGIAEKNGYITKIDFAVLDQVIAYLEEELNEGENVVPISVNFSRRNNEFDNFVPNILKRMEEHNIPANLLEAEVTESIFMADLSTVDNNINLLRKRGVEVSVDDFGSGFSSLNMLARISADTIKLDRLFINNANKDERGLTVIKYLTKMLKQLGFTVLAEGVETEEQLNWMMMAGCDLVQGFYYAKPMSIADFKVFFKEFNSRVECMERERI